MSQSLNTGITVPPLPRNERAHAYGLDILPASFGEGFGAQFDDQMVRNPTASIARMLDRAQYFPSTDEFGFESPARTPSKILTAQEANDQYGIPGHLKFDADTPEPIAQELKKLKTQEVERQDVMRRAQSGIGTALSAGLVASVLDPLNIASAFIPVVGEARYAAMVTRLGVTGARAARGAIEGAVGAAIVEPFTLAAARYEQADYDAADSLVSIAFGTALGAGLHVAGGAFKDRYLGRAVDDLPAADREALLRTSVAQVAEGRPVEVGDLLRQRLLGNVGEPLEKVFDDLLPPELRTLKAAEAAAPERMGPDATAFALKKQVDAVGRQADAADARVAKLTEDRKALVETVNQPLVDAVAESKGVAAEARKELADAKINLDRASRRANTLRDSGVGDADPKLVRAIEQEQAARERFAAADEAAKAVETKAERIKAELANYKANEAKRVGDRQAALDTQIERAKAEVEAQKQNLQDVLTAADAEREGRMIEFRSQLEQARAQATEALRVKLAEAAAGPRVRMEPEGERFLADIERRFSEVQARPEAVADEIAALEAELKDMARLLPAESSVNFEKGSSHAAGRETGDKAQAFSLTKFAPDAVKWSDAKAPAWAKDVRGVLDELSARFGVDTPDIYVGGRGRHAGVGDISGLHTAERNGKATIWVADKGTAEKAVATAIHEFGHHVQARLYADAPESTKLSIEAAWRDEAVKAYKNRASALDAAPITKGIPGEKLGEAHYTVDAYYSQKFNEWFAEQVSRWVTTRKEPVGVVEKFFNKIGEFWRVLYAKVPGALGLRGEVSDFIEGHWRKDGFSNENTLASSLDNGTPESPVRSEATRFEDQNPVEKEANVYAKAWEEAVACRIRKA